MSAYYNDNDPAICEWLRELIRQGLIPEGDVDCRPIQEVTGDELRGYDQVHLFAGIGGWAYALELAGWTGPVWTGSPPCQPFSSAARGRYDTGKDLWLEYLRLVASIHPDRLLGEQVPRRDWLDRVCDDLEALGYEVGAAILPACGLGFDHVRERIYFACHAHGVSKPSLSINGEVARMQRARGDAGDMVRPNGLPQSVVMRGFGNSVVPQVAAEFVRAYMEMT